MAIEIPLACWILVLFLPNLVSLTILSEASSMVFIPFFCHVQLEREDQEVKNFRLWQIAARPTHGTRSGKWNNLFSDHRIFSAQVVV